MRLAIGLAIGVALAGCGTASGGRDLDGDGVTDPTPPVIPKVLAVSIVTMSRTLVIGEQMQYVASVSTVGGALTVVSWSSSDTAVATTSNNGLVRALAIGSTVVTATSLIDTTKRASATISVGLRPAVNGVTITPTSATIEASATVTLTATVTAVGGASTTVNWSTSDPAIATVSPAGVVTGVAAGTVNITATSTFNPVRSSTVPVTVILPPP